MRVRHAWALTLGVAVAWSVPSRRGETHHDSPLPGFVDPSFGVIATPIGTNNEWARDVAVDGEGRIVVAGFGFFAGANTDIAVVRYLPGGQLDPAFGTGGKVTTALGFSSDDVAEAVAVQPDGRIVVAGHSSSVPFRNFVVVRYNANGSLDTTFGGGDGHVVRGVGGDAAAYDLALQPDGKILLVGSVLKATTGNDLCVVRYHPDGGADLDFGVNGTFAPTIIGHQIVYGVALTGSDRILLAGEAASAGGPKDFLLARLTTDGELDTLFGSFGLVFTSFGPGDDWARGIAVQSDGKIVLAGSMFNGSNFDYALARYHASGSLDAGFSGDGRVTTTGTTGNDFGLDVQVQPTGRIVAAGYSHNPVADFNAARVFRLHMDGTRDTGFGTGGGVFTVIIGSGGTAFDSIALQPDGKIVAAGHSIETSVDFAVARYHGHVRDHIFEDGFDADVSTAVEPGT